MLSKKDLEAIRDIVYQNGESIKIELRKEMYFLHDNLKAELRGEIRQVKEELTQFKDEFTQFKEETRGKFEIIEKEIHTVKKEVAEFKDEMMGQLKDIHDDISILAGHQDVWEDHEKRIVAIERRFRN